MIGTTVGKYRIIDRLGRGGMGTVYKAIDETLDRVVAIKVLNPDLSDAELLRRFRAEAVSLAKLNHPGIATIYELHRNGDDLLMVMEFVRGETLQAVSERLGPLEPPQAAHICIKILDGLAHAHHEGIIHRDLKPANVMMSDRGAIKIMDFGIARMLGGEHFTQTGYMMGTPAYMAPEQVLGKEVDARVDLYSVGVLFYRLLARELPFKADTAIGMAQKQIADPPTPIVKFRPDLAPWCQELITKALAKDPDGRFQTAEEFRGALRAAVTPAGLGELPTMATPATLLRTSDVTVPNAPASVSSASTIPMEVRGTGSHPTVPAPVGTGAQAVHPAASTEQVTGLSGVPAPATVTGTGAIPPVERTGTSVVLGRSHLISISALIAVLVAGIAVLAFVALRRNANSQQAESAAAVQQAAPATTPADASQPPAAPQEAPKPVEPPPAAPAAAPAATTPTSGQRGSADAAARKKAAAAAKTPEVAPPTEPVAAPPPPPTVEPPPPPPAPAVAPVTFKQVKLLVAQGDALRDRDAALRLAGDHLAILDRSEKAELLTLPYSAITGAIYSRSKQPKWKGADGKEQELRVDLGKMGFFRGERNWLILTRAGEPVIIRLEDTDLRTVLPAFQERSGLKIQR